LTAKEVFRRIYMKFIIYPAGIYQANCYIVYEEKTNEGFIIDPGGDADGILAEAFKNNIKVKYLVLTHGHFDHTGAVNDIKSKLGIPLYLNEKDNEFLLDSGIIKFIKRGDSIAADAFLKDGDILKFGDEKAVVLETPGHTPGGIHRFHREVPSTFHLWI
jgi:glyoxylase-like metal-dependent hydrolase (beta-lactamase superfamily II)